MNIYVNKDKLIFYLHAISLATCDNNNFFLRITLVYLISNIMSTLTSHRYLYVMELIFQKSQTTSVLYKTNQVMMNNILNML